MGDLTARVCSSSSWECHRGLIGQASQNRRARLQDGRGQVDEPGGDDRRDARGDEVREQLRLLRGYHAAEGRHALREEAHHHVLAIAIINYMIMMY